MSKQPPVGATGQITPSLTAGIDLASQPEETGLCVIDWSSHPARVVEEDKPTRLDDDALLRVLGDDRMTKVAIDAPFGFPMAFVDAMNAYQSGNGWLELDHEEVRFRATEHWIRKVPKVQPLSSVTDRLVWPTMRCARLLSTYAVTQSQPVDRAGGGRVMEVYPAAALRVWGIGVADPEAGVPSYKGDKPGRRDRREQLMNGLRDVLGGAVELSDDFIERCTKDDDDLDAFVCALIARAAVIGHIEPVPAGSRWAAHREGWINLPRAGGSLADALGLPSPPPDL